MCANYVYYNDYWKLYMFPKVFFYELLEIILLHKNEN